MRTRKSHVVSESTVLALSARKNGQTQRALAVELGLPPNACAMLSDVLRRRPGALTQDGENDLRQRLDLPVIITLPVPPCPTCGAVHVAGDCHGAPVAAVVILQPGQRVQRARPVAPAWVTFAAGWLALRAVQHGRL